MAQWLSAFLEIESLGVLEQDILSSADGPDIKNLIYEQLELSVYL